MISNCDVEGAPKGECFSGAQTGTAKVATLWRKDVTVRVAQGPAGSSRAIGKDPGLVADLQDAVTRIVGNGNHWGH